MLNVKVVPNTTFKFGGKRVKKKRIQNANLIISCQITTVLNIGKLKH